MMLVRCLRRTAAISPPAAGGGRPCPAAPLADRRAVRPADLSGYRAIRALTGACRGKTGISTRRELAFRMPAIEVYQATTAVITPR